MVRLFVSVVLIAGCSFEHANAIGAGDAAIGDDATADATPDMAMPRFCSTDPHSAALLLGEAKDASCSGGGSIAGAGITIGSNHNGSPTLVDEWLLGAVDNVRFWDTTVVQLAAPP